MVLWRLRKEEGVATAVVWSHGEGAELRILADGRVFWKNSDDPWAKAPATKLASVFSPWKNNKDKVVIIRIDREAKFHAIADHSYDVELWIGTEGRLIWINPRIVDMFGYTPEECLAMENFPAALVEPEDVARTIRQIRQALRGNAGQDFEFRARRKDGTVFPDRKSVV